MYSLEGLNSFTRFEFGFILKYFLTAIIAYLNLNLYNLVGFKNIYSFLKLFGNYLTQAPCNSNSDIICFSRPLTFSGAITCKFSSFGG